MFEEREMFWTHELLAIPAYFCGARRRGQVRRFRLSLSYLIRTARGELRPSQPAILQSFKTAFQNFIFPLGGTPPSRLTTSETSRSISST